jgi:hypothetical protein
MAVHDDIASTNKVGIVLRCLSASYSFHQEGFSAKAEIFFSNGLKLTGPLESALLKPSTDKPSSVRVPVLSKTKISVLPATLILGGEMQNMFDFFSRLMAKIIPHDIAAGSAGGTVMVIKSSERSISWSGGVPALSIIGMVPQKPIIASRAIMKMNFIESA